MVQTDKFDWATLSVHVEQGLYAYWQELLRRDPVQINANNFTLEMMSGKLNLTIERVSATIKQVGPILLISSPFLFNNSSRANYVTNRTEMIGVQTIVEMRLTTNI